MTNSFFKSQKSICWIRQPFFFVARLRKFAQKQKHRSQQVYYYLLSTIILGAIYFKVFNAPLLLPSPYLFISLSVSIFLFVLSLNLTHNLFPLYCSRVRSSFLLIPFLTVLFKLFFVSFFLFFPFLF
jgi:hypothetical protein